MQHTQQNFNRAGFFTLLGGMALIVSGAAHAGIAVRNAPEPLLHDGTPGPCDHRLATPDYVSGVDVNGNPVAPADLAKAKTPVPNEVLVPLKGRNGQQGPVIAIDGRALDPILNPAAGCAAKAR